MNCRITLILWLTIVALGGYGCANSTIPGGVNNHYQPPKLPIDANDICLSRANYSEAVAQLSSDDEKRTHQAVGLLIDTSKRSPKCRSEVVAEIMSSMDKPDLNFDRDLESYWLWRNGSELLGDLHAVEALDLLISHLDLHTSTFSSSMSHMPALRGVIKIGSEAILKLDVVLKTNPQPSMRYGAVYCLATIGGPSAVQSLREASTTESDKCVKRFIRISLESFDEAGNIKDRGKWFSGVSCGQ